MIRAGTCFCHRCGNLSREAYYKSGQQPVGAKLRHPLMRLGKNRWEIRPFCPDGGEITLQNSPRLVSTGTNSEDGFPDSIDCTFGDNKTVYELVRSCPMCKSEHTALRTDNGRYPTFVVAMVGATQAGKTAWLHAVATDINLNAVNGEMKYPYCLEFLDTYAANEWNLGATAKESSGATNYLRIKERGSNKIVANVLFLDAAGELYQKLASEGTKQRRFLVGNGEYTGVDAVIYVESAMMASGTFENEKQRETYNKAFEVYRAMGAVGALDNKPVAFVYSHTDLMIEKVDSIPKITDMSGTSKVPVCTKGTFAGETSYAPSKLWPRLAVENLIAKRINETVLMASSPNRRGFMIQTCRRKTDGDGKPRDDYRERFNVMDPLLWVLNTLNIFPIPQK